MTIRTLQYLFVFIVLVRFTEVATQDDWSVVMNRVHDSAITDSSHQDVDELLALLQPDGSFSDLNYEEGGSKPYQTHGRRLGALGYHYNLNGADVAQHLITSFSFITYDAPPNQDSNWWGHLIGIPTYSWEGVVLARDVLSTTLRNDFLNRYWVNTIEGPVWNPEDHTGRMAGGNFAPRAMMAEVEGLLRENPDEVHVQVTEGMVREFEAREGWDFNGLRADGCLHQHTVQGNHSTEHGYLSDRLSLVYNGNYGSELLKYASKLLTWFTGTSLDFSGDTVEGVFQAYLECNQWLFRGHTIEPTVCGRFITDGSRITKYGTQGSVWKAGQNLLLLGPHFDEVNSAIHRYENIPPDPQHALQGHKHFFNSDLTAHQRINYMATVRVLSNRTCRPETYYSGANKDGFFQGDGFMITLVDGKEYGEPDREVFQVYDWARVPGVTNHYTKDIPKYQIGQYWAERFFNNATFVGGVTDGWVGLTFMQCRRPHVPLTALKSWFFFSDAIIVMGSNIHLDPASYTGESVISTLEQNDYIGQHVLGQSGGQEISLGLGTHQESSPEWLHHRRVGYVFLAGQEELIVSAEPRLLDAQVINVFTAWIDHGPQPDDASLAYVVLPDADLDKTRAYSMNPEVVIVSQSSDVHAVCHSPSQTVGAALLSAGTLSVLSCGGAGPMEVTVDVPCLILTTVEDSQIIVSLADPQQMYDTIQLSLTYNGLQMNRTVSLPGPPKRGSSTNQIFFI